MQSTKRFICVAIVATSLLGCVDPAEQPSIENVVQPQANEEAGGGSDSVGAGDSTVISETPSIAKEQMPATEPTVPVYGDQFPKVMAVEAKPLSNNRWQFNVTLSSPYDSPQRYADAWRVLDEQGNELGIRILGHDHASEQPFTRSSTITLPENTTSVFVEGRDQANGWSGQRFAVELP